MMLLSPTDTPHYRTHARRHPHLLGYLAGPRKRGIPRYLHDPWASWAADNDAYSGNFDPQGFTAWLQTLTPFTDRCLFVTCPDVLADHEATIARFQQWQPCITALGFPVAFVLQDGITADPIPWDRIDALFVGGTTHWKLSPEPLRLLHHAGTLGIWRHVGRVNSLKRMLHFWNHADSFDGTTFAIEPDNNLRRFLPVMLARTRQRSLLCPSS